MNTNMIIAKLNNKQNGSWFNVKWCSDIPMVAAYKKMGHVAYKITAAQCRKGIEYAKQKSVIAKVDKGYVLAHELPWGQWKEGYKGLLLEHKNEDYLRLYFGPNKTETKYYIDGIEYTYQELKDSNMILPSFFTKAHEKPDCISVKCKNIQEIW